MGTLQVSYILHPLAWLAQHSLQPLLLLTNLGLVLPPNERGRRDHDRIRPPLAALQPEAHPPIVKQVELKVPTTAQQLPLALTVGVLLVPPARDDAEVGRHESARHGACKTFSTWRGQVVKEDAADATRLPSAGDVEIAIAPRLKGGIISAAVRRTNVAPETVELGDILLIEIGGR
eukprot:CAMPEP_0119360626 /NCGR_PEP_ID=MMETSP1334-20130426/8172_1 /TAXON_ID=127549 /ORGANISM="Calcidiscus leptoporus, Strain RCC1130" /LENGTH=175 /DNA_ID=CAMNT_0007375483 /DNA_START=272 /DNA_END=799 /DNA_ORIENTATION=+